MLKNEQEIYFSIISSPSISLKNDGYKSGLCTLSIDFNQYNEGSQTFFYYPCFKLKNEFCLEKPIPKKHRKYFEKYFIFYSENILFKLKTLDEIAKQFHMTSEQILNDYPGFIYKVKEETCH